MHESNKSEMKLQSLEAKIQDLEKQLVEERKLAQKTLAESEELSTHLQHTTLALAQERQIAEQKALREKLLNSWIEGINSSLDVSSVLRLAAEDIGKYLQIDRTGVAFFDEDEARIEEYTTAEWSRDFNPDDIFKNHYIRTVIETKNALNQKEIELDKLDDFSKDLKSIYVVPLFLRNNVKGVIYLQRCERQKAWHKQEIDLVNSIAMPLITAIEKAKLYEESKAHTEQAQLLNSLTADIRSSLNLHEILGKTVNELGKAFGACRCFLYFEGGISEEYCAPGVKSISHFAHHFLLDKIQEDNELHTIVIERLLEEKNLSKLNDKEREEILATSAQSVLATPLHFQNILQGWIIFHSCSSERHWTRDEIIFIESIASQVIVAMTQSRMYEKLNSYQAKLSRELKQAARVQTSLIGGDVFDADLETSVFYKAHSNVSGDFYWIAELAPHVIGVLIGDVSGKGPAAALLTGYLLGEFNSAVSNSSMAWYPERMINFLCRSTLYQNSSSDFYATAWYGVFDLCSGTVNYTNGGHLNPYLVKNTGEIMHLDEDKDAGVPLGLLDPKDLEECYERRTLHLDPGDKMLLFTDGVIDQKMPGGEFVPKDWIEKTLEKVKDREVKEITYELNERLNELSGGTPLTDDRLMVCLKQTEFEIYEFDADNHEKCEQLIQTIINQCLEVELPRGRLIDFKLGLTEAITNAVRYGLKRNPYGKIKIGYKITEGSFKMSIVDPGPGFNWQMYNYTSIEEVRFEDEGGRGIPLLHEIFDKITWNPAGNQIGLFLYW